MGYCKDCKHWHLAKEKIDGVCYRLCTAVCDSDGQSSITHYVPPEFGCVLFEERPRGPWRTTVGDLLYFVGGPEWNVHHLSDDVRVALVDRLNTIWTEYKLERKD